MKKKGLAIAFTVGFSLPIPVALFGALGCFIWLLSSVVGEYRSSVETAAAAVGIIIGLSYLAVYIFSVIRTWKEKRITVKTFFPLMHCLLAVVYLVSLIPTAHYVDQTREFFGFAKRDFVVVEEVDTHGGFHGDGTYCLILDCSENREKALEIVQDWNSLPLTDTLESLLYKSTSDEITVPKIENGYYIFIDRSSESVDRTDDSEVLRRYSVNVSFAVYDLDTDRLYCVVIDT